MYGINYDNPLPVVKHQIDFDYKIQGDRRKSIVGKYYENLDLDERSLELVKTSLLNLYKTSFQHDDIFDLSAKITAHTLPKLLANHIVGVQPLLGTDDKIEIVKNGDVIPFPIKALIKKMYSVLKVEDLDDKNIISLADEIGLEHDQELLRWLRDLLPIPLAENICSPEKSYLLGNMIEHQSNQIGIKTGKRGNWAIVSPAALTYLKFHLYFKFNDRYNDKINGRVAPAYTQYCGLLYDDIQIFCDTYAHDDAPILVGYKVNDYHASAYWAPYVPIVSNSIIMDPHTFDVNHLFVSRYGKSLNLTKNDLDHLALVGVNMIPNDLY